MRNLRIGLTISILILLLLSCKKTTDNNLDFYNSNFRVGLWINTTLGDTLEFIDNTNLIRKGNVYKYEQYLYRINHDTLFIHLSSSMTETQHAIIKTNQNSVTLGNMYISFELSDNSGTFIKSSSR